MNEQHFYICWMEDFGNPFLVEKFYYKVLAEEQFIMGAVLCCYPPYRLISWL